MSMTVQGVPFQYAGEAFRLLNSEKAQRISQDLKNNRVSSLETVPEEAIGTIDATSCIGVCYHTPQGSVIVKHVDKRMFQGLQGICEGSLFQGSEPVKATLIGGMRHPNERGDFEHNVYLLDQKYTFRHFEDLVSYWRASNFKVDIQGWAIGDNVTSLKSNPDDKTPNERLCSDFLAAKDQRVCLLKHGLAVQQGLVPELPRRMGHMLSDDQRFIPVYDSTQGHHLALPKITTLNALTEWCKDIRSYPNDESLLQNSSTTPTLEPSHFCKAIKNMADYVLSQPVTEDVKVPLTKRQVIILQGEVGRLKPTP